MKQLHLQVKKRKKDSRVVNIFLRFWFYPIFRKKLSNIRKQLGFLLSNQ